MTERRTHPVENYTDPRGQGPGSREALELHRGDPTLAPLKHGVYLSRGAYMICDRCCLKADCEHYRAGQRCRIEEEYSAERYTQIAAALQADAGEVGVYSPLVSIAILAELRLARAMKYLAVTGEVLPGIDKGFAEMMPLAREIPRLMGEVRSALAALNLTPAARARLTAQKPAAMNPLVRAILAVDAEEGEGDDET